MSSLRKTKKSVLFESEREKHSSGKVVENSKKFPH